jgi:hypothetical protein
VPADSPLPASNGKNWMFPFESFEPLKVTAPLTINLPLESEQPPANKIIRNNENDLKYSMMNPINRAR